MAAILKTPLQLRVDKITAENRAVVMEARRIAQESEARMKADAVARTEAMERLRAAMLSFVGSWRRPCWICGSGIWCDHREPELIELWEKGKIR